MKKLLLLLALIVPAIAWAQSPIFFKLQQDGTFLSPDGKDFIVVEYEGKTAHELYQMLTGNVASTYNDPSKVMSSGEDAWIKVRAIGFLFPYNNVLQTAGIPREVTSHYQLEFKIKDGRVRVAAPYVEENGEIGTVPPKPINVVKQMKGWMKNEKSLNKNKVNIDCVESALNTPVNRILGTLSSSKVEEDW